MQFKPILTVSLMMALLCGCSSQGTQTPVQSQSGQTTDEKETQNTQTETSKEESKQESTQESTSASAASLNPVPSDYFSERDMKQDLEGLDVQPFALANGTQSVISAEGVYRLQGTYSDASVVIDATDTDKVQLVLDGLQITNSNMPCIYVKNADKVFITVQNENTLSVNSAFVADGDTNTDAVIFSRDDLVFNGTGSLQINSSENGISSKDEVRITGGNIGIQAVADGIEANESIAIADAAISISSDKDCMNAGYDEDQTTGEIVLFSGIYNLDAADDGVQATTYLIIQDGTFNINAAEGLEASHIIINGGLISILASDDGINAARKSDAMYPEIEINGGEITIDMGPGDTDAIDSNGNLSITGGTLNINAQSPFDYDGQGTKTGGTIIVNGTQTDALTNQMMGGGRGNRFR